AGEYPSASYRDNVVRYFDLAAVEVQAQSALASYRSDRVGRAAAFAHRVGQVVAPYLLASY
ncbi:MAG: hypothetical protein ACI9HK_002491, partial [Pirellulaceae bacterium]